MCLTDRIDISQCLWSKRRLEGFMARFPFSRLQRLTSFCCWTQTYFRSTIKFRSTRLQTKKLVATELPLNHSSKYPYNNKQGKFSWRRRWRNLFLLFTFKSKPKAKGENSKTSKGCSCSGFELKSLCSNSKHRKKAESIL